MKTRQNNSILEAGIIFTGIMLAIRIFITPMLPGVLQKSIQTGFVALIAATGLLLAYEAFRASMKPVRVRKDRNQR